MIFVGTAYDTKLIKGFLQQNFERSLENILLLESYTIAFTMILPCMYEF